MENVARRKTAVKDPDKYEVVFGAELPPAQPTITWKAWTFCLLLGCIFTISAGLFAHSSIYGASLKTTTVKVDFRPASKLNLPAVTTKELEILPLPNPLPFIYVQDAVVFPDNVMLLVQISKSLNLEGSIDNLECQFGTVGFSSDSIIQTTSPVICVKPRNKDLHMVRCRRPDGKDFPSKFHNNVTLGFRTNAVKVQSNALYHPDRLPSWESLVYENLIDSDSLILLAKGLVSKSSRRMDASSLMCVFGSLLPAQILYETEVLTAAQEVIRCAKPPAHLEEELRGCRVSVKASWLGVLPSVTYYDPDNRPSVFLATFLTRDFGVISADLASVSMEGNGDEEQVVSSVEPSNTKMPTTWTELPTLEGEEGILGDPPVKRKLCACTMVWNKARFIREWVTFHSYLGVEKYFVYDNDSDDGTEEVLDSLKTPYNISRVVWPWIKTQQAAFSHCTIIARDECEWMMFSDVDEFIYPYGYLRKFDSEPDDALTLHRVIDSESSMMNQSGEILGQLQFDCHNFGPSGLNSTPKQGVTVGYTCRMKSPERHKSIIMLDSVNSSLLNVLHHFELQEGYQSVKLPRKVAVVNHYKFPAWDSFKMKFIRRAGTYTTDWQKEENRGSKDRTPGLGIEAVKPADWESRFCEVSDTGLRDFSLRTFALPGEADKLEWQLGRLPPEEL